MTASGDGALQRLEALIDSRRAVVGVCGMGYVGLPLALAAAGAGFEVIGFDIDPTTVGTLNAGKSHIGTVVDSRVKELRDLSRFSASLAFDELSRCDVVIVCVPTPLTRHREPDLSYIRSTSEAIAARLRPGQLIILESTTYPGTTQEVVKPILEKGGLVSGIDFLLAFSPEREDPGNRDFGVSSIPKIAAGDGARATDAVCAFYRCFVSTVIPVSTTSTAEAVKITENVFRAVNIALVNELKIIYAAMGIDIWEVIEAAKTKPFGFMPFYPGPGMGGHCIPIDPFYLTWKSREYDLPTRFIELAGEVNLAMPKYVVEQLANALSQRRSIALSGSRILMVGISYKKNVADMRESPSIRMLELLEERGAKVDYTDPLVPKIPKSRQHASLTGRKSVALEADTLREYDAVLIATDHDVIDYKLIADNARLVIDTRNAFARRNLPLDRVVKA